MSTTPTTQEQPVMTKTPQRVISLGLPANADHGQRRFALTPEAVRILTLRGIEVRLESGAGNAIHYDDERYASSGARIVTRPEALNCDMVMHLSPMNAADVRLMRRGALLLTLLHAYALSPHTVEALLERRIVSLALDLIADDNNHRPFADIISDIDGRAAVTLAAAALADAVNGKGILLGGIPGIVPCEVTVIGAGLAGRAATSTAIGMGATVRLFDDDSYRLRRAMTDFGPGIIVSALHTSVLEKALRTADVVVVTDQGSSFYISPDMARGMKDGVLCYDVTTSPYSPFPNMQCIDLAMTPSTLFNMDTARQHTRRFFTNPGAAVPRTTAMAVSNTFVMMLSQILTCDGVSNAIKLNTGIQRAVFTFSGHLTNAAIARRCSIKHIDISLLIQFS